jgi:hypothetical protein
MDSKSLHSQLRYKRLERGRFLWPSSADGVVTITPAQLGYLDAATYVAAAGGRLIAGI